MEITQELSEKIQELQILERNLQSFSMEKQTLQVELNEIINATDELKKSGDEVYKMLGGLMIKANKESLSKELNEKKKVFELRVAAIEKQEKSTEDKTEKLRKDINDKITVKKQ